MEKPSWMGSFEWYTEVCLYHNYSWDAEQVRPGSKTIAVQEFYHRVQKVTEQVNDFICMLEQSFWRAYGKQVITVKTCDTLLQGQLHRRIEASYCDGINSIRSQELCVAEKNECRQPALSQHRQYKQEQVVIHKHSGKNLKSGQGFRKSFLEQRL